MAQAFTSQNFQAEVLESTIPVLVDFWAPWCGPCQAIGPIIEKLAKDYEGKMKIGKLDVDENSDIAAKYEVQGIPSLKFFKDGAIVAELTGAQSEEALRAAIESNL